MLCGGGAIESYILTPVHHIVVGLMKSPTIHPDFGRAPTYATGTGGWKMNVAVHVDQSFGGIDAVRSMGR